MTTPHDWCRTVECDGTTVLLMRGWNDEMGCPTMSTTFQIDHFIAGDTEFGQTTVTAARQDGEDFTTDEWEAYCQTECVIERVNLTVSTVLRSQDAVH